MIVQYIKGRDISEVGANGMVKILEDYGFDVKETKTAVQVDATQDDLLSISEAIDRYYQIEDDNE